MLQMLRHLGHEAAVVGDGDAVLEALQTADYDVILMDVCMPKRDGLSTTQAIHLTVSAASQPYIIAMTGNVREQQRAACLSAGMAEHLSKPVSLDALQQTLERAAHHRLQRPDVKRLRSAGQHVSSVSQLRSDRPVVLRSGGAVEPHGGDAGGDEILDQDALTVLRQIAGARGDAFLTEMIDSYLQEAPQIMAGIEGAIAQANFPEIAHHTHSLKSMSAALGATQLSEHCRQMEMLAQQPMAQVNTLMILATLQRSLQAELDEVCGALQGERCESIVGD